VGVEGNMDLLLDKNRDKLFGVFGLDGIVEITSRTQEKILGYSLDGLNVFDFIHPDDHKRITKKILSIQQTKESIEVSCRYKRNNGWTWLTSKVSPVLDDQGNVDCFTYLSEVMNESLYIAI
jgi:PAS domain S-box-containing protein